MHYEFPKIEHIDQVLPHLDDSFVVKQGDCGNTYINYGKMWHVDQFPPADTLTGKIRRECRGIAFDTETGRIVSRPFHKFFNLDERDDARWVDAPHTLLEKLDGSMVRPVPTKDGIRWATRAGVTEVAMMAEAFVAQNPKYLELAEQNIEMGWTPIFEYIGPHNRVVLEYPEGMVLLAVRRNLDGLYSTAQACGYTFDIPFVQQSKFNLSNVKQQEGIEGLVIRYHNGHMLKVKGDWYVKLHRAKEYLDNPRRLVEVILDGNLDDILPAFLEEDQRRVEEFSRAFWLKATDIVIELKGLEKWAFTTFSTKKDFALATQNWDSFNRNYIFKKWDGKVDSALIYLEQWVRSKLNSATKFEEVKERFGI